MAVVNEPDGWLDALSPLPEGVRLYEIASEPLDVIVYFSDERANVERRVPVFAGFLAHGGTLWSAVPERSADLGPEIAVAAGTGAGLVAGDTLSIAPGWTAVRLSRPA